MVETGRTERIVFQNKVIELSRRYHQCVGKVALLQGEERWDKRDERRDLMEEADEIYHDLIDTVATQVVLTRDSGQVRRTIEDSVQFFHGQFTPVGMYEGVDMEEFLIDVATLSVEYLKGSDLPRK